MKNLRERLRFLGSSFQNKGVSFHCMYVHVILSASAFQMQGLVKNGVPFCLLLFQCTCQMRPLENIYLWVLS